MTTVVIPYIRRVITAVVKRESLQAPERQKIKLLFVFKSLSFCPVSWSSAETLSKDISQSTAQDT